MNYPPTLTRRHRFLYSLEQREGLNEIINIHGTASTHAPGHSDPSQDLPSKAGRGNEENGSVRMFGREGQYTAQVTQEMPGKPWGPHYFMEEARKFSADHQEKNKKKRKTEP